MKTKKTKKTNRQIITDITFQGELCFKRVSRLPEGVVFTEAKRSADGLIVGHSETGHHHVVEAADARLLETPDPLIAYLVAEGAYADLVHRRSFDTHPTRTLEGGGAVWQVIRQREKGPEGWVRVAD